MSHLKFFKCFLSNPAKIGALCPSSEHLCEEIVSKINLDKADVIVELGPGTGVITRSIIRSAKPDCRILAIELDPDFYQQMCRNFAEIEVHNDNAGNLGEILRKAGLDKANAIVSGLPWAIFPEELQRQILRNIADNLTDDGYFTTFAYVQGVVLPAGLRFKKLLKESFSKVETGKVVWRNLPPAFIYRCKK